MEQCCRTQEEESLCAQVGEKAPDFSLDAVLGDGTFTRIALKDQRGKWVVLFFYPLDFTFICPTEITGFSARIADFEKLNAKVFGVSTDSVHSHKAWLKDLGDLKTPLLSDKTHQMSDAYGVLIPDEGIALRGTFIIDPEGLLKYTNIQDNSVGRSIDEVLRVLSALQTGELCPVNWHAGEKTLGKA